MTLTAPLPSLRNLYVRAPVTASARIGAALLGLVLLSAVFAQFIAPHDPYAYDLDKILAAPTFDDSHYFGTDELGRDVLSRCLYGARTILIVSVSATAISVVVGASLGVVAGFAPRWLDAILGRVADIQLSIPGLVLALLALALFGSSTANLIGILALEAWPLHYRIVRSHARNARTQGYLDAAHLAGVPLPLAIWRHVIPSAVPLLATTATISVSLTTMTAAGLSYLGLGVAPPTADWGLMIANGKGQLTSAWWLASFPSLFLIVFLLSVQLLGDALASQRQEFETEIPR